MRRRDDRRLLEREVGRLERQLVLTSAHVFGEGALADSHHLITWPEPGHVLADRLHAPSYLTASNRILRPAKPVAREAYRVRQAGHEMPDAPFHTSRAHADEHLIVFGLGLVDVPELEHVGRAVLVLHDGLHRSLPAVACSGRPSTATGPTPLDVVSLVATIFVLS